MYRDVLLSILQKATTISTAVAYAERVKRTANSVYLPVILIAFTETFLIFSRTGKVNSFGWLRYSGFVRHKEPHLDAAGALADLLVFTLNRTGLDILAKIESHDTAW